jgi:hypothetical protein
MQVIVANADTQTAITSRIEGAVGFCPTVGGVTHCGTLVDADANTTTYETTTDAEAADADGGEATQTEGEFSPTATSIIVTAMVFVGVITLVVIAAYKTGQSSKAMKPITKAFSESSSTSPSPSSMSEFSSFNWDDGALTTTPPKTFIETTPPHTSKPTDVNHLWLGPEGRSPPTFEMPPPPEPRHVSQVTVWDSVPPPPPDSFA